MNEKIFYGLAKYTTIFARMTEEAVAGTAQQSAHLSRDIAMIDRQAARFTIGMFRHFWFSTNCTNVALTFQHQIVFLDCDSKPILQVSFAQVCTFLVGIVASLTPMVMSIWSGFVAIIIRQWLDYLAVGASFTWNVGNLIARGYNTHVNVSLLDLTTPRAVRAAPWQLYWLLLLHYSMKEQIGEAG